jgi:hypothetical protein
MAALRVQDRSAAVEAMATQWGIVDALLGGTPAMRKAGQKWLPKFPAEDDRAYDKRLNVSTLYPAFRRTLTVMAGKPFSKALTIGEDVPTSVRKLTENIDQRGRNLHTFAHRIGREALAYGICGVLTDYPKTPGTATLADVRAAGARPYAVFYKHDQILGWQATASGGAMVMTQLRLAEQAEKPDGPYGTVTVDRVRVLVPGGWELHEDVAGDGEFVKIDEGATSLQRIPFTPFYGEQVDFMVGRSPLLDLAYLCVKHWQSQSDQDNITHVARVPILFGRGMDEKSQIVVGSADAVKSTNPQADLKFVEHTGAAIGAGRQSLIDLDQQMVQTGAELLVVKPGQRSATEANNDAEANKSDLQVIGEGWEDSIDQVLQDMAEFSAEPEGGHVALFKDFGAATLTDASAQLVLAMQQGGLITKQTAIREQQRRGMLAADLDAEAEIEAASQEGPALGSMGGDPDDPDAAALATMEGEGGRPAPEGRSGGAPGAGGRPAAAAPASPAPLDPVALGKAIASALAPAIDAMTKAATAKPAPAAAPQSLDLSAAAKAFADALAPLLKTPEPPDLAAALGKAIAALPAPQVTVQPAAVNVPPVQIPAFDAAALAEALKAAMPPALDAQALATALAAAIPKPARVTSIDFVENDAGELTGARINKEPSA